jgi:hypothetical protein
MGLTAVLVLKWTAAAVLAVALIYGGLAAFGGWRWSGAVRDLVGRLDQGRTAPSVSRYHAAELAGLPVPVQRYFRAVLTDGQPIVTAVRLTQSGLFNLGKTADQWKPFTATQHFVTARPGFVWDATIAMFPGVPVRVVDAFIAGEGLLRPTILGLFDMGTLQGAGEIARGELLRHFAESIWFPTALLPSQGVAWTAVDDTSASATLTDGPILVTMLFRFGADGLVTSITAAGRATEVDGVTVQMPWECRMSDYQMQGGMRVPMMGEVLYQLPQGERPYFRGTVTQIGFAFAQWGRKRKPGPP